MFRVTIEKFTALEAIDLDNGMPLLESLDVSGLADSLTRLQAARLPKLNTLILGNNANLQALCCSDDPLLCELDISGCTKLLNKEEGVEFEHNTALNIITDEETRYAPKFYGKSLMLSGNLGLYFYVKLPVPEGSTFDELYDGSYMTFAITEGTQKTKDFGKTAFDKTETITITEYGKEVTLYGFRCGVNSAQIADKIAALFHYGTPDAENNNQMKYITLHAEEGEAEGTVTVSEYLDALTAKDIDGKNIYGDETADLANAIKDYGYYAQEVLKTQYDDWNHTAVTPAKIIMSDNAGICEYTLSYFNTPKLTPSFILEKDNNEAIVLNVYMTPDEGTVFADGTVAQTKNAGAEEVLTAIEDAGENNGKYLLTISEPSTYIISTYKDNTRKQRNGYITISLEKVSTLAAVANDVNKYALTETDTGTGLTASYTLVLDSSTDLEVYLEPSTVNISGATIDGKECTVESNVNYKVGNENKTGCRITLPNIPAHKLGEAHEVILTTEDEKTLTIGNLSAMSYVHKVLSSNESSENLKNAAEAIYNYFTATNAYRASDLGKELNPDD